MTYPTVRARTETALTTAGTTITINFGTNNAGDLCIAFIGLNDTAQAITTTESFTNLTNASGTFHIIYKQLAGTEGTSTTVTVPSSTKAAVLAYTINTGTYLTTQAPQYSTVATGTSTAPNPGSLSPTGGAKDYLWIAAFRQNGEEADDDTWCNSAPTNFTNLIQKTSGTAGNANTNGSIAAAEYTSYASSMDPGAFDTDQSLAWRAYTVAIHPVNNTFTFTPTADAIIKKTNVVPGTQPTADAIVKKTISGASQTFTANAVIRKTITASATETHQATTRSAGSRDIGRVTIWQQWAQSIVPGISGSFVSLTYPLYTLGSPSDSVIVELQTNSGGSPSGTVVGTIETVAAASLPTSWGGAMRTATTNIVVQSGSMYWIVFRRSGSLSDTNRYATNASDDDNYASGVSKYYISSSWTASSDLYFSATIDSPLAFTANASITGFLANAVVEGWGDYSATWSNNWQTPAVEGHFHPDAVILKTQSGAAYTFTADAVIKATMAFGTTTPSLRNYHTYEQGYGNRTQAFGWTATAGSLLVFTMNVRGNYNWNAPTGGWTRLSSMAADPPGGGQSVYYKIAAGTESAWWDLQDWQDGANDGFVLTMMEISGATISEYTQSGPKGMYRTDGDGTITADAFAPPSVGQPVFVVGSAHAGGGYGSWSPLSGYSELSDAGRSGLPPVATTFYKIDASASSTYAPGSVMGWGDHYAYAQIVAFAFAGTVACPVDAVIKVTVSGAPQTFTANAIVKATVAPAGGAKADAVIFATISAGKTLTADAIILANSGTKTFAADATVRRTFESTSTANAVVKRTIEPTATADAIRLRTMVYGPGPTLDAVVSKTQTGTFSAAAVIKATMPPASVTVTTLQNGDASHNEVQQITVNATGGTWTLYWGVPDQITVSWDVSAADLQAAFAGKSESRSITKVGNVYTVEYTGSSGLTDFPQMTADGSNLVGGAAVSLDSLIRKTASGSFAADAVIFTNSGTKTFAAAAILRRTFTPTFAANAVIRRTQLPSATADAIRKRTMVFGVSGGTIAQDSFTETSGPVELTSHVPEIGTWSKTWDSSGGLVTLQIDASVDVVGPTISEIGFGDVAYSIASMSDGYVQARNPAGYPSGDSTIGSYILVRQDPGNTDTFYGLRGDNDRSGLYRCTNGSWSSLGSTGIINGLKYGRLQATGVSPTALKAEQRATLGELGTGWSIEVNDSTAANQVSSGNIGISGSAGAGEESGGWSAPIDNFLAVSSGTPVDGPGPTLDAALSRTQAGSFSAAAVIKATITPTLTANSVVFTTVTPAGFTANAVTLRPSGTLTFTTDATIKREQTASKTLDAAIKKTLSGSGTADAIRLRTMVFGTASGGTIGQDSFTGGASVLTAHTPEIGGGWTTDSLGLSSLDISGGWVVNSWGNDPGQYRANVLTGAQLGDGSALITFISGNYYPVGTIVRQSTNNYYQLDNRGNYFSAYLYRVTGGSLTQLGTCAGSGSGAARSRQYVSGTGPTTLKVRLWDNAGAEPETWGIQTTDNTAANQMTSGGVGVHVWSEYEGGMAGDDFLVVASGTPVDGPGPTLDAVVNVPRSGSFTTTAVIKANSGTKTFVADAVVRRGQAAAFTGDAIASVPRTGSLTGDAVVDLGVVTVPGSLAADAIVLQSFAVDFTAKAWVQGIGVGGFALDAVIAATTGSSFAADAIVTKSSTSGYSADAVVSRSAVSSLLADAIKAFTTSSSWTANAVISSTQTRTFSSDSVIRKEASSSFSSAAVVLKPTTFSFTADAALFKLLIFTADGIVRREATGDFTAKAWVEGVTTGGFSLDAVLWRAFSGNYAADAVVQSGQESQFGGNAVFRRVSESSALAQAVIRAIASSTWSMDAISSSARSTTFGSSAVIFSSTALAFSSAAIVRLSTSSSFTADAVVKRTETSAVSFDAVLLREGPAASLTTNAIVLRTQGSSFSAEAVVRQVAGGEPKADAVIQRVFATGLTADAIVRVPRETAAVSDAFVQPWFRADAYISAKLTADSVLLRTQSGSFTANAWVQGTGVSGFSLDAVIWRSQSGYFIAFALMRSTSSGLAFSGNAIIRGLSEGAVSADSLIKASFSSSFSISAIIASTSASPFSVNAIISATASWYATAAAIILRPSSNSCSSDSVFFKPTSASFTADGVARLVSGSAFAVDAVVLRAVPTNLTTDAIVLREQVDSFTAKAWVQGSGVAGFAADAVIFATPTSAATGDAVVRRTALGVSPLDAVLHRGSTASLTTDAIVQRAITQGLFADAVLFASEQRSFAANAWLAGTFIADGIIQQTNTGTTTADSVIMPVFAGNAILRRSQDGLFTAGAWIPGEGIGGITASAVLRAVIGQAFTENAVARVQTSGTLYADAVIAAAQSGAFIADAVARKSGTGYLTADAVLVAGRTVGFSANSVLLSSGSGSANADAVLRASRSSSALADSTLRSGRTGQFTGDATLGVPRSGSLTANAYILAAEARIFSSDAVIFREQLAQFPGDALINQIVQSGLNADAAIQAAHVGSFRAEAAAQATLERAFQSYAVTLVSVSESVNGYSVISRSNSLAFTAGAWITGVAAFSADAVISGQARTFFSADSLLILPTAQFDASLQLELIEASLNLSLAEATLQLDLVEATLQLVIYEATVTVGYIEATIATSLWLWPTGRFTADAVLEA